MDIAQPPENQTAIVITASRLPETAGDSAASSTIIDAGLLQRLGEPSITAYLRLLPSTAVAVGGPAGSFTQVRIRGAEANHTLLFVDGIRANDPAAGNEPRFELLNADIASRIEQVRGPQSALWGSEAIGGVISVDGSSAPTTGASATVEAGSFGFRRGAASASYGSDHLGVAVAYGHSRADGIDSFNGHGDRDGFRSDALRGLARWSPVAKLKLTASGFFLGGWNEYDSIDPVTYLRADTLDRTKNRIAAGRIGATYGEAGDPWQASLSGSILGSSNINLLDNDEINRTKGRRGVVDAQVSRGFATGTVDHLLIVAASAENEHFTASDIGFGGYTDQSRGRQHRALTGEWRATIAKGVVADVAVRRDMFNRFKDATTARASLLVHVTPVLSFAASYGEGIAQPTFFDLYGFFPGSFVGNPSLKTESSRGFELSAWVRHGAFAGSLTAYRQRLRDEIVGTYDPGTFLNSAANADGASKRQGVEAEASWSPLSALRIAATYAYLDASEPVAGTGQVREIRRPRHSGSITLDGVHGKLNYGASMAFVGRRVEKDFDLGRRIGLSAYWLAGARVGYSVRPGIELFARIANAFDDRYQDVVGYRTEGRSGHAGLRLALGS
ncbi:MAG: TonB-dependent receptor [Sphingomicrobium sp.]